MIMATLRLAYPTFSLNESVDELFVLKDSFTVQKLNMLKCPMSGSVVYRQKRSHLKQPRQTVRKGRGKGPGKGPPGKVSRNGGKGSALKRQRSGSKLSQSAVF